MKTLFPFFSVIVIAAIALLQAGVAVGQESAAGTSPRAYKTSSKKRELIRPLFIEFTPGSPEAAATMEEDLNVMCRLLDKALDQGLGEDSPPVKLNLPLYYTGIGRSVRAMYLEDFGALFMIKVNFPVIAAPQAQGKNETRAAPSEWDQVKLELHEDEDEDEDDEAYAARLEPRRTQGDSSQVDSLKSVLLLSLKHAANIRNLKPDEFIALSVFGSELSGAQMLRATAATAAGSSSRKKPRPGSGETSGEAGDPSSPAHRAAQPADDSHPVHTTIRTVFKAGKAVPQGTVLNLRARKADVDAFAKGEMNLETFKSRAVFHSYIGNGYGILSINSWTGSPRGK